MFFDIDKFVFENKKLNVENIKFTSCLNSLNNGNHKIKGNIFQICFKIKKHQPLPLIWTGRFLKNKNKIVDSQVADEYIYPLLLMCSFLLCEPIIFCVICEPSVQRLTH